MFYGLFSDITIYAFILLVAAAAYSDVKKLIIPNSYSLSIVTLYPAFVMTTDAPPDWLFALAIAAAVFALGFGLFALKYIGGGDVKLFSAVCLWAGPNLIVEFFAITTITGGVIAIGMWLVYRTAQMLPFLPQGLTCDSETFAKKPMPYGAAIALGGVYVAFTLLR